MHLFLILPEKFDDATPHDAAVGVTVPARDIPLQQHMIPIHFKRNLRTVLQDIQLPPFPGAVEKQAKEPFFSSYPKLRGTTYTSLPSHSPRRHTLNRATISIKSPCRVTSLSFLLISRRPPSIHSCKGRHVRRAGSHSVRKPPEVRKYPFPTASIHRHGRSATPPSGKHSASTWNWRARASSLCKKPDGESPPWMPAGALRKGHQTYPHANAERAPPPDNGEGTNARPRQGYGSHPISLAFPG